MKKELDFKLPGVMELGKEEMQQTNGGIWWLVPIGWIVTEIVMNPRTSADTFTSAAEAELAKIRAEQ